MKTFNEWFGNKYGAFKHLFDLTLIELAKDAYTVAYLAALYDLVKKLEDETDPESWGSFALPKVREVAADLRSKMLGEGND